MSLIRFGVSIEEDLLNRLDEYVKKHQFPNRSQAIRQIISELSVNEKISENQIVAGSITLVLDPNRNGILQKIQEVQSEYLSIILSSMHFHIDHHHKMEIIAVKGFSYLIKDLSEKLISIKGVEHGNLSIAK